MLLMVLLSLWLGSGVVMLIVAWLWIRGDRPQPIHRRPAASRIPRPRRAWARDASEPRTT